MALVAAPFFAILFAIIQLGYRFFVAEALDTAVAEASRAIMTGQVQSNGAITTAEQFRDQVLCNTTNRLLPDFMDCSKLVVDVRQLSAFGDASFSTSATDLLTGAATTYSPGAKGSIIVARAAYPLPAVAPSLTGGGASMIGGELQYALLGVFVFRNEPF
ncbi:MAG: pilus assembly protein [Rhodoblastus sp.]|nr:MAG: pilus assembly protein [Rhodoblastus sp.]